MKLKMVTGIGSVPSSVSSPVVLTNSNSNNNNNGATTQLPSAEPIKRPSDNRRVSFIIHL